MIATAIFFLVVEACVLAIELLTANGYKLNGIEKGGEI